MTDKVDYTETGKAGLERMYKWLGEAHTAELQWPQCAPLYNRIWRSDPEVTIARNILEAWAGGCDITAEVPVHTVEQEDLPVTDDDKRARDFLATVMDDTEDTFISWLKDCLTKVPFYGWGFWEIVPGMRKETWKPPGDDPWTSDYNDGLIGIRRIAQRRYSSFGGWDYRTNGSVSHFIQTDHMTGKDTPIPIVGNLHVIYGDIGSPEGVGLMEAIWRLERMKYALEIIQGIGYEHSAGHLSVSVDEDGTFDEAEIARVARNILSAQPGNYAAWPKGVNGEFIDATFGSAESILNAIRYLGILKLALLGMQFVSISTLTGSGSYAAMADASDVAISIFNNISRNIVTQVNRQVVKPLFKYKINAQQFPEMTRLPVITISEIKKPYEMGQFALFLQALNEILGLDTKDFNAIRKETGFLPQKPDDQGSEKPENEPKPDDTNMSTTHYFEGGDYPDPTITTTHVTFQEDEIDKAIETIADGSAIIESAINAEPKEPEESEDD